MNSPYENITPQQRLGPQEDSSCHSLNVVFKACAGTEAGSLWKDIKSLKIVDEQLGCHVPDTLLDELVEAYNNATTSGERIQVLSLAAKTLTNIRHIKDLGWKPKLQYHQYHQAEMHAHSLGSLKPPVEKKIYRSRIDDAVVEAIFEFICDTSVMNSTAYGTLAMDIDGEKKHINKTVRTQGHATLVKQLKSYLQEANLKAPGDSTLFTILNICVASKSQILRGLDNIKEAARKAFRHLISAH